MHKAVIASIRGFQPIPGADRIQTARVFNGTVEIATVVIDKQRYTDELGVYFCPDLQLSEEFAVKNDLLAVFDENGKKIGGGYFNHKRRVTAQRFKGTRSDGLWLPLDALAYTGGAGFQLGMQLDSVNGHALCNKYYTPSTARVRGAGKPRAATLDDRVPHFPKHPDTEQLAYFIGEIPAGARIVITEKEHGTSHRVGRVRVRQSLAWWKRLANWTLARFGKPERYASFVYALVHGSRNRVVKVTDAGFHGSESFRFAATGAPPLEDGLMVFGEITGYAGDRPIMQPHNTAAVPELTRFYGETIVYDYGNEPGTATFRVYDAAYVTETGERVSLPWGAVRALAQECGYSTVLQLMDFTYDGDAESLLARVKALAESVEPGYAPSAWGKHPGEGVVIRVETGQDDPGGIVVKHYKYKSFVFKVLEGIIKADDSAIDAEDVS